MACRQRFRGKVSLRKFCCVTYRGEDEERGRVEQLRPDQLSYYCGTDRSSDKVVPLVALRRSPFPP